ncbi:MAG: M23 family metallopeptidase [bacterium]|nr:M23 family metallopeptidase [bacterium]
MSSIHYLDNGFLWGKAPRGPQVQEIKPREVVYFHDFHQARKSKFFGIDKKLFPYLISELVKYFKLNLLTSKKLRPYFPSKTSSYFSPRMFFVPSLLSALGVVLLSISLLSPATLFFAPNTNAASTSYPPQVVETQTSTLVSKVETEAEIKASNIKPPTNTSFSSGVVSLPEGLSRSLHWPARGYITTYFSSSHSGIDIAASYGTPIHPFMEGVVSSVNHFNGGFGNHVIIKHNGFESLYAHLSSTNVVVGQIVKAKTVIGWVGVSGWATGPHLHFEVSQSGQNINPLSVLP